MESTGVLELSGIEDNRHIDICVLQYGETPWQHAYNCVGIIVQQDLLAKDGLGTEAALPKGPTQKRDAIFSGLVFFAKEIAPVSRVHAQERQQFPTSACKPAVISIAEVRARRLVRRTYAKGLLHGYDLVANDVVAGDSAAA